MQKFSIPLSFSIALHAAVGIVLTLSMSFTHPVSEDLSLDAPIIDAVVVDQKTLETQVRKLKDEKTAQRQKEEQRVKELERRAEEAERERRQKETQVAELEKQTQNKLNEKKKADQAAVEAREKQQQEKAKAAALEEQRKRKEQERIKADEQAKAAKEKREKEEKALKEAERKKQEAAEQAAQEKLLQEQLQAEQATRQQRRNKQVLTEVQKYEILIKQTIQRNLIVDDAMKGKSCRLNIRLASNGLVTQVKELSGDAVLCRAAIAAVKKSDTLPVSPEADVFEKLRDINLTVEPGL
ncbi:cell envelope integrity protein TolA [Flavobacterium sp. W21_SRS_FM6]|uniref:cell envelope integrity protein TolA n=1 Tax=Flavobacterium sp. W21_SRS_FM6 TaxID=3240268 RepID=UPI003F92135E